MGFNLSGGISPVLVISLGGYDISMPAVALHLDSSEFLSNLFFRFWDIRIQSYEIVINIRHHEISWMR